MAAAEVLTTANVVSGAWWPYAAAFAPDGARAYVATQDGHVYIIDPTTHASVGSIDVPGGSGGSGELVISADGSTGYLAVLDADKVFVLDLTTHQVADVFEVVYAESVALSADGSRLYVGTFGFAGESAYNLWMFDTQSGEFVAG